jgi:hypothetical protein
VVSSTPSENGVQKYANVVVGRSCKHETSRRYRGRVKLVSSLAELAAAAGQPWTSIALTKTFGNEAGETEAVNFAGQQRIMTVRREHNQCIGCAVNLAHAISALAVIA